MMKTNLFCAVAVLALASCSSDSLVGDSPVTNEAPIAFNVGQRNITRAVDDSKNLEKNGYTDFGVFAYKVKSEGATPVLVMGNYKVAYTAAAGETPASWDYVGKATGQVTRYWDYSTAVTNFYAYAPYASATEFNATNKTITVSSTAGYEAKNDVIYAGKSVEKKDNGYGKKVPLQFKHVGAKVNIAFRENVPGYKVQLIDVKDNTEAGKGIQLTPAIRTGESSNYSYTKTGAEYNKTSSVVINYSTPNDPTTTATATESSSDNLVFVLPTNTELSESDYEVSTTTYYAVVQSDDNPGFTLHVSYKLIAEDNNEEIIVRDARVFIPANMVKWESNKAYTYNFTITTASTGSTGGTVDVTSPVVPTDPALNPIVFDTPTIVDYEAATLDPSDTQI